MEDMSKEGGEEERRNEKKEKEQKREKQKHLAPASALTPNTPVPY